MTHCQLCGLSCRQQLHVCQQGGWGRGQWGRGCLRRGPGSPSDRPAAEPRGSGLAAQTKPSPHPSDSLPFHTQLTTPAERRVQQPPPKLVLCGRVGVVAISSNSRQSDFSRSTSICSISSSDISNSTIMTHLCLCSLMDR